MSGLFAQCLNSQKLCLLTELNTSLQVIGPNSQHESSCLQCEVEGNLVLQLVRTSTEVRIRQSSRLMTRFTSALSSNVLATRPGTAFTVLQCGVGRDDIGVITPYRQQVKYIKRLFLENHFTEVSLDQSGPKFRCADSGWGEGEPKLD